QRLDPRQRLRAAPARDGGLRDRAAAARARRLDGRRAGIPVGREPPGLRALSASVPGLGAHERAPPGLPPGAAVRPPARSRVARRPVRASARGGAPALRSHLCRLGPVAAVLLAAAVPRGRLLLARGLPRPLLGGLLPRARRERPPRAALD